MSVSRRGFVNVPRRALTGIAVATLAVAVLASCTAGPSPRPAVVQNDEPAPQRPAPPPPAVAPLPPLENPGASTINWGECDADTRTRLADAAVPQTRPVSCSTVSTPLDPPGLPQRGLQRIALLKVGTGPVPLTVVNDIDGELGTVHAARLATQLPDELLQRFSLVGVDRRGTGGSEPVRCIPSMVRSQLVGADPAAGVEGLVESARKAGQQCSIGLENEQGAFDSWRAAGDLDHIRNQLGLGKLNAISHGEGSKVLSSYTTRFTDHVGRFVLDGIPDPAPQAPAVLGDVAAGLESTLDAFATHCANTGCPLGQDAKTTVAALIDRLRTAPIPTTQGQIMGPGLALHAIQNGLSARDTWPALAEALAAAQGGDAGKLASLSAPLVTDNRAQPSRLDASIATKCNDSLTRLPPDRINAVAADLRGKHPVFGGFVAQQLAWCTPWPARGEPLPEPGTPGAPPMLVLSAASDPVTPEAGTAHAAEQMPSAVRVAWQGAGHGALTNSACAAEATRKFLIDGVVPRDGTLCPA